MLAESTMAMDRTGVIVNGFDARKHIEWGPDWMRANGAAKGRGSHVESNHKEKEAAEVADDM